ncbi:hypothetical protein JW766_01735 [Candidatus Dojkabacteria bacterium]|nr:hypothetical protein [Candidatus Dojkabacteria bacterium]
MIEKIPEAAQNMIDRYFNLPLNGKKVRSPYYISIKKFRQRMGLRVLIGKGSPEEIVQESLIYEKLRGVDFNFMTVEEIREFLVKRRIGIDCSGFVVHVLNAWLRGKKKKNLCNYLKFPKESLYRKIARLLRPIENISAEQLTSDLNTTPVKNLNNIRTGDLIRSKLPKRSEKLLDRFHVMLIIEVDRTNGKVNSFKYAHSTRGYDDAHGTRTGEVIVKNASKPLCGQEWSDEYKGRNWTKEELCADKEYGQVRRLKNVPLY